MNYFIRIFIVFLSLLFVTGCAGGPMAKYDADRLSESKWKIKKKPLLGGGLVKYTADLKTKGNKFLAKMTASGRDPMTGATYLSKYTVRCNGKYVWITDQEFTLDGRTEKDATNYRWAVDQEFLRPQLFWKSNHLAGAPEEKGTEKIDGKEYKVLESVMGNAMGGSTKYTYAVDEGESRYRRLSREFVGDAHVDVYDCIEYKSSTTASDSDFSYNGEATEIGKFDIFNEAI